MKNFETFGKYILLERLAAGGMAEVFLAKSTGAGGISKFVAIKRILPQYSDNPEFIDMFKEEARIAMNLNHGNVVGIYDFGVEQKQFFLVMEFVEGQNLRQILNHLKKETKDFNIEQCVYIAKQVAAGLDHAHRCIDNTTGRPLNITHRDMSPQNIMISFEGEVKVVDFGIAKAESEMEHTRAGTIKGKFGYMSPEQAEGLTVDSRTDIFSLGIVLWEILAKDRLFTANSEAATLRKIRECQIPSLRRINPSIPPELERIVNKALAKDKNLRYQATAALHRDLNRFINLQYPEFSPQDFAIFMKSAFSQMYIDNRRKQVEYAKATAVQFAQMEERTHVTKTETKTDTQRPNQSQPTPPSSGAVSGATPGTSPVQGAGNSNHGILQLSELPIEPGTQTKVNLAQLKTKVRPIDKFSPPGDFDPGGFSKSSNSAYKKTLGGTNSQIRGESSWGNGPAVGAVILFFLAAIFAGFKQGILPAEYIPNSLVAVLSPELQKRDFGSEEPKFKPIKPDTKSISSPGWQDLRRDDCCKAAIQSEPSDARIYINDIDQGTKTPVTQKVPANKEFRLTLVKDGYVTYSKVEKISEDGATLKANLQPLPPVGYISIRVANGGADAVLYLNGIRQSQKLPVNKIGVPGDSTVKIKVLSPLDRLAAEHIVFVKTNESKDITLTLKRESSGQ